MTQEPLHSSGLALRYILMGFVHWDAEHFVFVSGSPADRSWQSAGLVAGFAAAPSSVLA